MTLAAAGTKAHTTVETGLAYLDVELTERCNALCSHCCVRRAGCSRPPQAAELSAEDLVAILADAKTCGCRQVRFTGGEPLLRSDFLEIYRATADLGLSIAVSTNGLLVQSSHVEQFSAEPPMEIAISLYGWDEPSYDAFTRTPGGFRRLTSSLEMLRGSGLSYALRYPAVPTLIAHRTELENLAKKLCSSVPLSFPWDMMSHVRNDKERNLEIQRFRRGTESTVLEKYKQTDQAAKSLVALRRAEQPVRDPALFRCKAGFRRVALDPYGNLALCCGLHHPDTIVNLRSMHFSEAMAVQIPQIRLIKSTRDEYLRRCGCCSLYSICGQCPSTSWAEHGVLDLPVRYYCDIAHREARLLGYLEEGQNGWDVKPPQRLHRMDRTGEQSN